MAQAAAPIAAIRIKNILFATDFSEISSYAIPYVACLARHFGATILPTHVIPREPRYEIPMDEIGDELKVGRREAARHFTSVLNHDSLRDLPQHVLIERGDVWPAIRDLAVTHEVDMIAIGTHGRGAIGKLVFGSVAEQIYRQATCPVLVVGPHASHHVVEDGTFKRLLFATDCSTESLEHLPFVIDLANAFGAFLKIVSVVHEVEHSMLPDIGDLSEVIARKTRSLQRKVTPLRLIHEAEIIVAEGPVGDSILRLADINNVDLIIMGARTTSAPVTVSHVPAGVTHFVAAHAHCPVLTVRVGDHGLPEHWQEGRTL